MRVHIPLIHISEILFVMLMTGIVTLPGCKSERAIRKAPVSIPSVPDSEIDAALAIFFDARQFSSSPLAHELPSLKRFSAKTMSPLLRGPLPSCLESLPSRGWLLIPRQKTVGPVMLLATKARKTIDCLSKSPGSVKLQGSIQGAEVQGTAFFAVKDGTLLALPTAMLTKIHPGKGTAGSGKLLKRDTGRAFFALLFSRLSLVGPEMEKTLKALSVQNKDMAEWLVNRHPEASGALILTAGKDLTVTVMVDIGEEEAASYLAKNINSWLTRSGYTGSVTMDHGTVELLFHLSPKTVDRMLSTFLTRLRAAAAISKKHQ